ncbi:phage tail protein [Vibrio vulnificus]|nr:phage tail protein [Vibrio vulnificus]
MADLVPESEQQYGSILTVLGESAEQNGKMLKKPVEFTHIAFGDANDTYVQPDRKSQSLVNELYRIPVNSVDVLQATPDSVPILTVEALLPDDIHDVVIREFAAVATFNGQEYFHAIGNCARIYVPSPINNGQLNNPVSLEMTFVITSAEPIVLINPNVITASRQLVEDTTFNSVKEVTHKSPYPRDNRRSVYKGCVIPAGVESLRINELTYQLDRAVTSGGEIEFLDVAERKVTINSNTYELLNPINTHNVAHGKKPIHPLMDAIELSRVKQPDLIDKARRMVNLIGMYYRIEGGILYVGFNMGDPTPPNQYSMCVEYRFIANADGLMLLRGCASGFADISKMISPEFSLTGSPLVTSSPPNSYANQTDTVLTGSFTGDHLSFRSYADSRGGRWKITLDNGLERIFSTWSEEEQSQKGGRKIVIFDELEYGTYQYTMEFLGDDPFHPPSSGTGKSRGWIYHEPGNPEVQPFVTSKVAPLDYSTAKWLIATGTIPDFAVNAKRYGSEYSSKWVPVHGSDTGVSLAIQMKITVDGDVISDNSAGLIDIPFRRCKFVKLAQSFYAHSPGDPDKMWNHSILHSLDEITAELSIINSLDFVSDTQVSAGYLAMLGVDSRNVDRVVYNNGDERDVLADDSQEEWVNGIDSVCYAGWYDQSLGISHGCVATTNIGESCDMFSQRQPKNLILQTWRSDNVAKTYWRFGDKVIVPAGTRIKSHTRHFGITAVRHPNNMLMPI